MSDHLTQTQIKDYGRRPLPAAEWLFVSDHLSVCEKCRLKVEATVDNETVYLGLKSGVFDGAEARSSITWRAHLTFEQMAGLIEGKAEGRASAEDLQSANDHLAWCQECDTAVDDLRDFKDQVAAELEQENQRPSASVAAKSRWRRSFASTHSFLPKSYKFIYGSALATLLLAAVGWLGWQALQRIKSPSKVAVTIPSPELSPSVSPALRPEDATMVIARLNDGQGRLTLDGEGKLSGADHLPFAYQQMVRKALTGMELERSPLLAGLTSSGGELRGSGAARQVGLSVVEPVGVVTFSDRPTFRWSRLEGATSYVVEVYDELFTLAGASPQITGLSWTATKPLKRGGIYYWQVKATKDGREFKAPSGGAPQAKFRILDAARVYELAQARRAYGSSRLLMGLLYAQAGLLDEAEREFRALQKANPNSELIQRLLKQVRAKS